jgi:hypothetical protein
LSERKASHVCANRVDATDNFMTGDDWQRWVREFAVDDMEVGAANAAGEDAQTQVSGAWFWKRSLFERKRRVRATQRHGFHCHFSQLYPLLFPVFERLSGVTTQRLPATRLSDNRRGTQRVRSAPLARQLNLYAVLCASAMTLLLMRSLPPIEKPSWQT